jgi:hypothetical protein
VNLEDRDSARFADVDFHGQPVSHECASIFFLWAAEATGHAAHGIIRRRVSCTKGVE